MMEMTGRKLTIRMAAVDFWCIDRVVELISCFTNHFKRRVSEPYRDSGEGEQQQIMYTPTTFLYRAKSSTKKCKTKTFDHRPA